MSSAGIVACCVDRTGSCLLCEHTFLAGVPYDQESEKMKAQCQRFDNDVRYRETHFLTSTQYVNQFLSSCVAMVTSGKRR